MKHALTILAAIGLSVSITLWVGAMARPMPEQPQPPPPDPRVAELAQQLGWQTDRINRLDEQFGRLSLGMKAPRDASAQALEELSHQLAEARMETQRLKEELADLPRPLPFFAMEPRPTASGRLKDPLPPDRRSPGEVEPRPTASSGLKVKVGDPFPDVRLQVVSAQHSRALAAVPESMVKTLSVADLKGNPVAIYFFPKTTSKASASEAAAFRDCHSELPKGAAILGVSADLPELQSRFLGVNNLPFPLLSDTELRLTDAVGVRADLKTFHGSSPEEVSPAPRRVTFVVDRSGKIARIFESGDMVKQPREVVDYLKALK